MSETPTLRTSQQISTLAAAFAEAQKAFPAVEKKHTADLEGTTKAGKDYKYSYSYADLSDVFAAIREPLGKHGLSVIQPIIGNFLITRLLHSSGEWIESAYELSEYEKPQEQGSEITYARRYALTAFLGIAAEQDDDGAGASKGTRRSKAGIPACPKGHPADKVIVSKQGPGFYCFECKAAFQTAPPAEPKPTAPPITPGSDLACPQCGSPKVGKQKYPKPGAEKFCADCGAAF